MPRIIVPYLLATVCMAVASTSHLYAAEPSASPAVSTAERERAGEIATPLAPYECLIGEWDVKATEDGPAAAIVRAKWGPNHSYIWYSSTMIFAGQSVPHLEGMLVWNAVHKNLDMLFCMDLKTGRVQEQGTMSLNAEGAIVRDITAVYGSGARAIGMPPVGPEGATTHFRETYQKAGPDKILTSAMRETKDGWVATFPGSDHLVMLRRAVPSDPVSGKWN
jgi:hypothetical protein